MIRSFALCTRAAALGAAVALTACGSAVSAAPSPRPPAEGVMLLDLKTGAVSAQTALGEDPLAVALAPDGRTAYVADNELGDVFALRLPSFHLSWRSHVGGAPSGLLVRDASVFVSQYGDARVAQLDAVGGRLLAERAVPPHPGALAWMDGTVATSGGQGFGIAVVAGQAWTAARLPQLAGRPFWLAPGRSPDELLVTAEGSPEDTAAGSVVALATRAGTHQVLATPRDPDDVEHSGGDVFIAAHGDRDVLVLRGGRQLAWARGAQAVALAPDPALGVLVVVTDAGE